MAHKVKVGRQRSLRARRHDALNALTAAGVLPTIEVSKSSQAQRVYLEKVVELGLHEIGYERWPCEASLADSPAEVFRDGDEAVLEIGNAVAIVALEWGSLRVSVAAPSRPEVYAALATFRDAYPATYITADGEQTVPITFWTLGPYGPVQRLRMIGAQQWSEIERNYPVDVRDQLAGLMHDFTPGKTGQLLLWQGPPGTGKTWALRALASEWGDWAEFHYITDPDAFFVDSSIYMIEVLLSDSVMAIESTTGDVYDTERPEGKWRVLILEDTGELLSATAKEKYGQGLSRLLNVVDGMIGQGLKVLCLVTTNDELGELNAAVRRPGRCASQIEFRAMNETELAEWLGDPNVDVSEATLAELYQRRGDAADDVLTAAAGAGVEGEIRRVAEEHQAEAEGYGYVAWNPDTKTVMYVAGDWTDTAPIEADLLAVDGVEHVEFEYEACPTGWCDAATQILVPDGVQPFDCDGRYTVQAAFAIPPRASYRQAEDTDRSCGTCEHRDDAGRCSLWNADGVEADYTCTHWTMTRAGATIDDIVALARMPLDSAELSEEFADEVEGGVATTATVAAALEALAAAHTTTVQAVAQVLTAGAARQQAGRSDGLTRRALDVLEQFAKRPAAAAPDVHVHTPKQDLNVHVDAPAIVLPEQPAPVVNVTTPEQKIDVHVPAAQVDVHVPAQPAPTVDVHVDAPEIVVPTPELAQLAAASASPDRRPRAVRVEYDEAGQKRFVAEYDDEPDS